MIHGVIRPWRRLLFGTLAVAAVLGAAACSAPASGRRRRRSCRSNDPAGLAVGRFVGLAVVRWRHCAGASPALGIPGATPSGVRAPVVDHGPRAGDRVALTFDADMTDGMLQNLRAGRVKSYANLRILDLLEREQVPATFFLTASGCCGIPMSPGGSPATRASSWPTTPTGTRRSPMTVTTCPGCPSASWRTT